MTMNTLRDAFRRALDRLADRGELWNRPPWIHDLARRLADEVAT